MESTNPSVVVALTFNGTNPPSKSATSGGNAIARSASQTAEGMAEYLNFLEKLNVAGDITDKLATYTSPTQISHQEMAAYYGALETHVMPFLGKYGYAELKKSVDESYKTFVREVRRFDNSDEGRKKLGMEYFRSVELIDKILTNVIKDFGWGEETDEAFDDCDTCSQGLDDDGDNIKFAGTEINMGSDTATDRIPLIFAPTPTFEDDPKARDDEIKGDINLKQENIILDMIRIALDPLPISKTA